MLIHHTCQPQILKASVIYPQARMKKHPITVPLTLAEDFFFALVREVTREGGICEHSKEFCFQAKTDE